VRLAERTGCGGLGVDLATAHRVASEADWDRYEWTLIANGERFLAEHSDAPEAEDLRAWIDAARDRVTAPGGRGTMGFALVLLRRRSRRPPPRSATRGAAQRLDVAHQPILRHRRRVGIGEGEGPARAGIVGGSRACTSAAGARAPSTCTGGSWGGPRP